MRLFAKSGYAVNWPRALGQAAMRWLIGTMCAAICPRSEVDPAALATGFLVAVGNEIGPNPYFVVERDRHHMNLFALQVWQKFEGAKRDCMGLCRSVVQSGRAEMVRHSRAIRAKLRRRARRGRQVGRL